MPDKDDELSEPKPDIQADEQGKVGGADIKVGENEGLGGADIKPGDR